MAKIREKNGSETGTGSRAGGVAVAAIVPSRPFARACMAIVTGTEKGTRGETGREKGRGKGEDGTGIGTDTMGLQGRVMVAMATDAQMVVHPMAPLATRRLARAVRQGMAIRTGKVGPCMGRGMGL